MATLREGVFAEQRVRRGEAGTSMIEFVIVLTLVFLPLLWGLITFGYAFSVRENLTHSAQEALRRSVIAAQAAGVPNGTTTGVECTAVGDARARMAGILGKHNQATSATTATDTRCGSPVSASAGGLDISTNYQLPAGGQTDGSFPACLDSAGNPIANSSCVTVTMAYQYGKFPIVSPLPGIFSLVPSTIQVNATERIR